MLQRRKIKWIAILLLLPLLLFHAFLGDGAFDWDLHLRKVEKKIALKYLGGNGYES